MSSVSNSKRRTWLGKLGTTSLEFALHPAGVPGLLLGTIDIARYLYTVQALVGLMGEAGRVAIMDPNLDVATVPQPTNWWPQLRRSLRCLTPTTSICASPRRRVRLAPGPITVSVTVSYPFVTYTPVFGKLTGLSGLNGQITESTKTILTDHPHPPSRALAANASPAIGRYHPPQIGCSHTRSPAIARKRSGAPQ